MQYQNASCLAVSAGRPRRSLAPLCASLGGSVGVAAVLKLVGVIAMFELVDWLLKAVVVLFQNPRASVSVLACHCAVEVRASASENLPGAVAAQNCVIDSATAPPLGSLYLSVSCSG